MAARQDTSDDEGVISIREAIQAEEILEEETAAVLGDADDNNCTYSKVNALSLCHNVTSGSVEFSLTRDH